MVLIKKCAKYAQKSLIILNWQDPNTQLIRICHMYVCLCLCTTVVHSADNIPGSFLSSRQLSLTDVVWWTGQEGDSSPRITQTLQPCTVSWLH